MRRSFFPSAALALLASLLAGGAAWSKSDKPSEIEIRKSALEYAKCVVKSKHQQATDAVLFTRDDGELLREFARSTSGCSPSDADRIGFGGDFYRYILAEALINVEFATSGPSDLSDRLPLTHPSAMTKAQFDASFAAATSNKRRVFLEDVYKKQKAIVFLSRYGECVVRADPKNALHLILTKPGSFEEISQTDVLRPAFTVCLEPGTLSFSQATMRGTLALNYYRLAHATAPPRSVGAN